MKKIIFLIAACGLLLASCAKPEPVTPIEGPVTFKVNAVNVIQTRGKIDTTSPEGPIPELGIVNVYAFLLDNGNYIYDQTIELVDEYDDTTYSATKVLADGTLTATGDYKFIGVGRESESDGYTLPALDGANFDDFSASIEEAGETNVIFAGNVTKTIGAEGATVVIDISRQVAGIFAYLSNVPVEINNTTVAYLRLKVSRASIAVDLATGEGDTTTATGEYYAIDIPLAGQSIDTLNNVYVGPGDTAELKIADNSQIASNYALPIDGVTMTLELQDASNTVLKSWSVVGPDGATTLNFEPNVLLAIGTKTVAGSELGADNALDGDGENADDAPQSLLTDQTIIVSVRKNWDNVQNLTLEEQP